MKKKNIIIFGTSQVRSPDLVRAASLFPDINLTFLTPDILQNSPSPLSKLNGVVYRLPIPAIPEPVQQTFFDTLIKTKKVVIINKARMTSPQLENKLYQQMVIKNAGIPHIPSYGFIKEVPMYEQISRLPLSYPFILKAYIGTCGNGVHLINTKKDLRPFEQHKQYYLAQPFIKNEGDFRIFVLGSHVLGMARRRAASGEFRNNVSCGGSVEAVTDKKERMKLSYLAKKITQIFELDFSGVDIILDTTTNTYRFMEINFTPNWLPFAPAMGKDVAVELLRYAKKLHP